MKVFGFMVPAEKVVTVSPNTPVEEAVGRMLAAQVGSIVVTKAPKQGAKPAPLGIITHTDIAKAYKDGIPCKDPCAKIMSKGPLHTCTKHMGRDEAAKIMQECHTHHLIVVDERDSSFTGLISSLDITAEVSRDAAAWPFPRFAKPPPQEVEVSSHGNPTVVHHKHDNITYADGLDVMQFQ